ncbi:MAG: hypothetical protein JWP03_68 [Phycisphaerales bacterium]|jgi:hypothetical protein|nr:hypothetical protein [Phycisphaerales bacterium]
MAKNTIIGGGKLYETFAPKERLVLLLEAKARGDEGETMRLWRSCPRKTYSGPDAAFDDRRELALDSAAMVCAELSSLTAQLRLLHWAAANVRHFDTMHHIVADMAFLEGVRCAQGLSQTPFFARKLRKVPGGAAEGYADADEVDAEGEPDRGGHAGDGGGADIEGEAEADKAYVHEDLSCLGGDLGRRMQAVEGRSEYATDLIGLVLSRTGHDLASELKAVWEAFGHFCTSRVGLSAEKVLDACGYPGREELTDWLKAYAHVEPNAKTVADYREGLCGVWDRRFEEE